MVNRAEHTGHVAPPGVSSFGLELTLCNGTRDVGSMLAGLSTILIALGALVRGPAVIRAWLDHQAADAEEARQSAGGPGGRR